MDGMLQLSNLERNRESVAERISDPGADSCIAKFDGWLYEITEVETGCSFNDWVGCGGRN